LLLLVLALLRASRGENWLCCETLLLPTSWLVTAVLVELLLLAELLVCLLGTCCFTATRCS